MNQQNHNNNPDGSGDVHLKRKRGRPRKYHRVEWEENAYTPPITQNINRSWLSGESSLVPPGFEGIHGNQSSQREAKNHADIAMVGKEVSGVIEAAFDAGYLLSVRIGNSDTILSGLAFKPGQHVPISVMVPDVAMIHTNAVPFLTGTSTQAQNPQPKEMNKQHVYVNTNENCTVNGSSSVSQVPTGEVGSSNLAISLGKNVSSVAEQTTHSLTGGNKVVPIVHPPSNNQQPQVLTQTSPADGNQAPSSLTHPRARGELVPIMPRPSNQPPQGMTTQLPLGSVSGVTKETPAPGNQVPSSSQTHPLARDKLAPVLPPPGNLLPLVRANNNQPQVMTTQASLGNVSSVTKQIPPAVGNIVPSIQIQPSQNTLQPRGLQNEDSRFDPSSAMEMNEAEDISVRLPDMPFEKLVTEVVKRIPGLSDSIVTETDNNRKSSGIKKPVKDSRSNRRMRDVQAGPMEHPAFTTKPLEIRNTSKVSELLEALQCKSNAEPET